MEQKTKDDRLEETTSRSIFRRAWNPMIVDIDDDVLLSGKPLDTFVFLGKIKTALIISAVILFPSSIFLVLYFPVFVLSMNWD